MERITGNEVQSMMEAYASVYKTEEQETLSEGYGKDCVKKEKKTKHNCAKKVCSEQWGEGTCIPEQHTLLDDGTVTHYDVMFEHGVEKMVPVEELEVLVTEMHEHAAMEGEELEEQQGGAMRGIKGPLHYLDTLLQGRKKADEIARNRGVLPKTGGGSGSGSGSGSGGGSGSGMTAAQIKAAQDKANQARRDGKMSDLRGGGGNTGKSPISNLSNALDKPSVVSPKTGETTKFERRLPTMAELRAAQAARKAAKAGGASDREAGYQAVKAGVSAGKPAPKPATGGSGGYQVSAAATPKTRPANPAAAVAAAKAAEVKKPVPRPGARNRMRMEEVDVFDTIKEYLIGEGATEEEALKQMLTLTDEQRTEIIEGSCGSKKKKKGGYGK